LQDAALRGSRKFQQIWVAHTTSNSIVDMLVNVHGSLLTQGIQKVIEYRLRLILNLFLSEGLKRRHIRDVFLYESMFNDFYNSQYWENS
jgi:hypothetical protein